MSSKAPVDSISAVNSSLVNSLFPSVSYLEKCSVGGGQEPELCAEPRQCAGWRVQCPFAGKYAGREAC